MAEGAISQEITLEFILESFATASEVSGSSLAFHSVDILNTQVEIGWLMMHVANKQRSNKIPLFWLMSMLGEARRRHLSASMYAKMLV